MQKSKSNWAETDKSPHDAMLATDGQLLFYKKAPPFPYGGRRSRIVNLLLSAIGAMLVCIKVAHSRGPFAFLAAFCHAIQQKGKFVQKFGFFQPGTFSLRLWRVVAGWLSTQISHLIFSLVTSHLKNCWWTHRESNPALFHAMEA